MSQVESNSLQEITETQFRFLGEALWAWPLQNDCETTNCKGCGEDSCLARRSKRLARFFEYYKDLSSSYASNAGAGEQPALESHNDILYIIQELKSQPNVHRAELVQNTFAQLRVGKPPSAGDSKRAINLIVRIMFMVNCTAQNQSFSLLEHGLNRVEWRNDATLAQFITDAFPMTDHPSINDDDSILSIDMKKSLKARELKKNAGLNFRSTDDLRCHLKLDPKSGTVEIFHQTAFLKEHLRLTKDAPPGISVAECLKRGALPRQLALEALDSIQKILFPLSEPKSYSFLRSLTSTASFDPDCLRFESASIRSTNEKDIQYLYFGARLADLYEELENPKPRGLIERWLERKSRARHVMMATVIGVIIAIFLGVASLAVGGYQAWIGYQQWQHPVSSSNG